MPRPAAKFLGPLAGLLLAFHGYFAVRGFSQASVPAPGWCRFDEIGRGILLVLLFSVVGRIVLAWLPPGPLGSHTPRNLPVTWAASFLLGLAAYFVELTLVRSVTAEGDSVAYVLVMATPWVLLSVLRVMTLPAAMVPRHEPRRERPGAAAFALYAFAVTWAGTHLFMQRDFLVQNVGWFALWILVAHGLGQARRAPAGTAVLVVVGLVTSRHAHVPLAAVYFGTGAVFVIGWLRRADRRACWLAAIAFASCAIAGTPTLAVAGLLTLVIASWPGQRRYAATASAASAVVFGLTGFLGLRAYAWFQGSYLWSPSRAEITDLARRAFSPSQWGAAWYLFAATVVVGVVLRVRSREVAREQLALLLLFVLGSLALFPLPWSWSNQALLACLFPVTVLLAGLVWVRAEEPD